ncbi:hypothetical protein C6P46_006986 [Rhodotorula mucilaginosa]|uniref:DUF3140 domain-containing protein n=1 Tax=Rhodotorula mucilaginosa TaxID=5537 RepID=A0A9P6VW68_RHOMI|nr:hypothetical protein C6P46_006986 [Rhodotorula mucilaginosa]
MTKSDEQVIEEFNDYVNMSADELREWLDGEDSQSAGWSKDNSGKVKEGEESVGHESGRKIIDILERNPKKDPSKYTDEDLQHMRKGADLGFSLILDLAAYCARHTKQESHMLDEKSDEELEKTKSVRSLRNWGHDPLKTK